MPAQLKFSLQQLAQIALGTPNLTNVNITILHSLIDLLLKKLNCADEVVTIGGIESKCLEKILKETKSTPLAFNDENIDLISDKLNRVTELEERINNLDTKLEKHFEQIRLCNADGDDHRFRFCYWEHYAAPCEDLCTTCEPENEIACNLLQNADFLKKLLRRVTQPVVDRVFEFERKIEMLHDEFKKFMDRAEKEYLKIALIERCIFEIELLRIAINENYMQFLSTMEEVQDMLDAKLDKLHLPALKKYIRERFQEIDGLIEKLQAYRDCPKAAGIVMGDVKCLSCGGNKVCTEVGVQATGILPSATPGNTKGTKKTRKYCGCDGNDCFSKKKDVILLDNIASRDILLKTPSHLDQVMEVANEKTKVVMSGKPPTCRFDESGELELIKGTNGYLYRAEKYVEQSEEGNLL